MMSDHTIEQAPSMEGWPDQWYVAKNKARISCFFNSSGEARLWARAAGIEIERIRKNA